MRGTDADIFDSRVRIAHECVTAIEQEKLRVKERDEALGKRDQALKNANDRADELEYQLASAI